MIVLTVSAGPDVPSMPDLVSKCMPSLSLLYYFQAIRLANFY